MLASGPSNCQREPLKLAAPALNGRFVLAHATAKIMGADTDDD